MLCVKTFIGIIVIDAYHWRFVRNVVWFMELRAKKHGDCEVSVNQTCIFLRPYLFDLLDERIDIGITYVFYYDQIVT